MPDEYLLEWTFTPPNLLEDRVEFRTGHALFVVHDGKAEAHVPVDNYPEDHSLRLELHRQLETRFRAAQVLYHRSYTLSNPTVARLHSDGRRSAWVFPEVGTATASEMRSDVTVTDAVDNTVVNTRQARIDRRNSFADDAASHVDDAVLNSMLASYAAAVNDPQNELIHLYEIREALAKHFGGQNGATDALGISSAKWSRLGRLADRDPLAQGRHRGKDVGALRDATEEELEEARAIARKMIEAYVEHIQMNQASKG